MTLEFYEYGHGVARNRLVACPFCPHEFDEHEQRWRHFYNDHVPEDVPALRGETA